MSKLPCPEELWPAFSLLLDAALQIAPAKRPAWLAALGPEHAELLPWIANVIRVDETNGDMEFLDSMPKVGLADEGFAAGQSVGPYLLERRLGGGGMGQVWLASRSDGTLSRRVALKLPHAYLLAGTIRRRFERERDILAALSHPHIALLYDAGVDELGHPYLAMEWVDGVALVEHCQKGSSSLQQRLELFLQILDAVAYAHGRLIAHRDIKPSNILITADHSAKLLDFGIAKLLTSDGESGETQLTQVGNRLATPDYAAPEQLAGEPITVAADIYALGVVLHELLAGQRPLHRGRPGVSDAFGRASTLIRPGQSELVGGMHRDQLRRALAGDLDAIIAKALEPVPTERYASAESFAQDIRLSRQNRPIAARHISTASVVLKYVRRHWLGVSMAAALLIVIIAGSLGIAWQGLRAAREAERATAIKDFLIGVFRASDPRIAQGKPRGEVTARELLDHGAQAIDKEFAQQPATQIELLGVTADIYRELDENKRSTLLYAREAELSRDYFGANDMHSIDGLLGQAYNQEIDGKSAEALALLARADPLIHAARLDDSATRARWWMIKGEALYPDPAQSAQSSASLSAAAEMFARVAPHDPLYPDALIDLGTMGLEQSKHELAAGYFRKAVAVAAAEAKLTGKLVQANLGLALALKYGGDFGGAKRAFEDGTQTAASTYGENSASYWAIASDWAQFRYERGERGESLAAFERLAAALPRDPADFRHATESVEASELLRKYGYCLAIDGQGGAALQQLQRAQTLLRAAAAHAVDATNLQFDFAEALAAADHPAEARAAYLGVLTALDTVSAPASRKATAHERWGRFLLSHRNFDDAAAEFDETLRLSAGHVTEASVRAQSGLGEVAAARADVDGAIQASQLAMTHAANIEGSYDIRLQPYVWRGRAAALLLAGNLNDARTLAQNARDAEVRYYAANSAPIAATEGLLRTISKKLAAR